VVVRDSCGRFTPNCQAIDREGRAPFAVRFVGFFALVSRIPREERMMREGVPGFADYTPKVPFRPLPGTS